MPIRTDLLRQLCAGKVQRKIEEYEERLVNAKAQLEALQGTCEHRVKRYVYAGDNGGVNYICEVCGAPCNDEVSS